MKTKDVNCKQVWGPIIQVTKDREITGLRQNSNGPEPGNL